MRKPISLVLLLAAVLVAMAATAPEAGLSNLRLSQNPLTSSPQPVSAHPLSVPDSGAAAAADAVVLYVDAIGGDDGNDGLSPGSAFRTLQRAANVATAGTTVRVLPGVYRETVTPKADGVLGAPITFVAVQGPGTVTVRGSEPSASLTWTQLTANTIGLPSSVDPANLYVADLSGWGLSGSPRFVVQLTGGGDIAARFPLAREPDWTVATDWRYHEYWWTADGGWDVAGCDPRDPNSDWNCDLQWRSNTDLTDRNAFAEPDAAIDGGDLTSLGDLTGAEMVALDAKWGHYLYRREIVSHDVAAGRIATTGDCLQDGGAADPGLGWGSKYYVEDHPALLDSPGEWWYDDTSQRLYLWPPDPGNPAAQALEISRRDVGVDLTGRSYITLDGLTVELVNDIGINQSNYWAQKSHGNALRNLTVRYGNHGVYVQQSVRADQSTENVTRGFVLESSEIAHMDTHGLFMSPWWDGAPSPASYPRSGMYNTTIRGNEFHDLGFGAVHDNAIGVEIQFPDRLTFEDNHVHDIAHNGVQFLWSVIDSPKSYGFTPDEIKIGEILVKDNLFEQSCQLTTDCGALKFWGQPPSNHVFRDVLVTGNVFRDVAGWSYVAKQRVGWWAGGVSSGANGQAGFGLYLDYAAGIHAYRNLAYNNSYAGVMLAGTWRDGDLVFANNTIADSLYGFRLSGVEADTHNGSVNTQILNNIIANSEGYAVYQCTANEQFGNLKIDNNLHFQDGWRASADGGVWRPGAMAVRTPQGQSYYPTLVDVQNHPYRWELSSTTGDPHFLQYNPADHDPYDGSWPDFSLTADSLLATDASAPLPASLEALLQRFGIVDGIVGDGRDLGWQESGGFFLAANPATRAIDPGGTASFVLSVRTAGPFASEVQVAVANPDARFRLETSRSAVQPDGDVAIALTDVVSGAAGSYEVPVTATGGGVTQSLTLRVLIVDSRVFLPMAMRR